jgi:hypothetical protein
MVLKKALETFQEEFKKEWAYYVEQDKRLLAFRGIEITKDNVDIINQIVVEIQDSYARMHEALYYMHNSAPNCMALIKEHKKFIDDLKSAGGVPDKDIVEEVNA